MGESMTARILLIDDDAQLHILLADYLEPEPYALHTANDGTSGLAALTVRAVPLSHRHREERLCQAVLVEGLAAALAVAQHDVVVELVLT